MTFLVKWYLIVCGAGAGAGEEFSALSRALRAVSPNTRSNTWRSSGCGWRRARTGPFGAGPAHGSSVPHSAPRLSLEGPVETAVLLSLVGVRSIVANQWPTVLRDNATRASILWEGESCRPPLVLQPRRAPGSLWAANGPSEGLLLLQIC